MVCSFYACFNTVSQFFQNGFEKLGVKIGKYAKILIPICLIATTGLSCGMLTLTSETNTEVLYTPINSRASQDRAKYQATFLDKTGSYYVGYAQTAEDLYGEIIFSAVDGNIFSNLSIEEIRRHIDTIKSINVSYNDEVVSYNDICAVRNGECFVSGEWLTRHSTIVSYMAGMLTYPYYNGQALGQVNVTNKKVLSAKYLKVTFHLRQDSDKNKAKAGAWEEEFLKTVPTLTPTATTINYVSSQSIDVELDKIILGDIVFFFVTFTLMITYATFTAGGDAVSSRTWAAWAGILAAGFGILSSFGLVSLCGVKFVNTAGVMPFLIIGIGVDDMFLLMSSWADTYSERDESIPYRMGRTFRSAGMGITITSLTDLFAFAMGGTSVFVSVRNFCIYTGVAVIFTYFYQCFFFGSCLAIHGRRVGSNRHCITCLKSKSRKTLRGEGKSKCSIWCCGGSPPKYRGQDERFVESIPRKYLPKLLLNVCGYITVIVLFLGYLGVSIWGISNFKQGLIFKNLVPPSSYYHTYADVNDNYFESSFPVPFIFSSATNFTDVDTVNRFESLFDTAKNDSDIDSDSFICWFHSYMASPLYDNSTLENFITGLRNFLNTAPVFRNDIDFDSSNSTIKACRCYLFSTNIKDTTKQADLMLRMRSLADSSPLSVYVFHPAYIYFEQYVAILPSTLKTVGITLAVMAVTSFIFLPHPLLVLFVVLNIMSIMVGIFGFLYIWDLTLSAVTMIHLIMSVGFSVDFSVHVCSAYMLCAGQTRKEKVTAAITHAAGPILNGGMSSFLGIIVLVFSKSYIFNSFFKIMFTVILLGMVHAVLFLPIVLAFLGPLSHPSVPQPHCQASETEPPSTRFANVARWTVGRNGSNPFIYWTDRDSPYMSDNIVANGSSPRRPNYNRSPGDYHWLFSLNMYLYQGSNNVSPRIKKFNQTPNDMSRPRSRPPSPPIDYPRH